MKTAITKFIKGSLIVYFLEISNASLSTIYLKKNKHVVAQNFSAQKSCTLQVSQWNFEEVNDKQDTFQ